MTLLAFAGKTVRGPDWPTMWSAAPPLADSAGDAISIVLVAVLFGLLALALRGLDKV